METAGEDTSNWPLYQPGFIGTIRQLTCCGRCGEQIKGGPSKPHKVFGMLKPNMHRLCDECFEKLPD